MITILLTTQNLLPTNMACFIGVFSWSNPCHPIRRWETAFARLRIGHTRLTHSYIMSCSSPTRCPSCDVLLTLPHHLLFCPAIASQRLVAFPHLSSLTRPACLADVLTESPTFSLSAIMSFLHC